MQRGSRQVKPNETCRGPGEESPLWRNAPFRRLFAAQVVSLVGSGLSSVALGLLAHQLVGASASAVLGATLYGRNGPRLRSALVNAAAPGMILALAGAGWFQRFEPLLAAWAVAGAGQCLLGIRGNELLGANSDPEERPHIYAAHFSLSHAGWACPTRWPDSSSPRSASTAVRGSSPDSSWS